MLDQEDCRWLWEELVDNGRVCYGGVEVTSIDEIVIISLMTVCKPFPESHKLLRLCLTLMGRTLVEQTHFEGE